MGLSHLWKTNKNAAVKLKDCSNRVAISELLESTHTNVSRRSTISMGSMRLSYPLPPSASQFPPATVVSVARAENFYALVNKSVKFNADELKFTTLQIKLDFYLNKLHFMPWRRSGPPPLATALPHHVIISREQP